MAAAVATTVIDAPIATDKDAEAPNSIVGSTPTSGASNATVVSLALSVQFFAETEEKTATAAKNNAKVVLRWINIVLKICFSVSFVVNVIFYLWFGR